MSELTQSNLFDRARALYVEVNTLKEDLDALADEFTYHKEDNVNGLEKPLVKKAMKAAEVDAANSFEKLVEKRMEQQAFEVYYKEVAGYDD